MTDPHIEFKARQSIVRVEIVFSSGRIGTQERRLGEAAEALAGASATFAGLILVFLGGTATAYDAYDPEQQGAVVERYRKRAGFTLLGFILCIVSCGLAIASQSMNKETVLAWVSAVTLAAASVVVIIAAVTSFRDIS